MGNMGVACPCRPRAHRSKNTLHFFSNRTTRASCVPPVWRIPVNGSKRRPLAGSPSPSLAHEVYLPLSLSDCPSCRWAPSCVCGCGRTYVLLPRSRSVCLLPASSCGGTIDPKSEKGQKSQRDNCSAQGRTLTTASCSSFKHAHNTRISVQEHFQLELHFWGKHYSTVLFAPIPFLYHDSARIRPAQTAVPCTA